MLETMPVAELTSGAQLFFCKPYSCKMLARACVDRQAKAALGATGITLDKCRGCELGAQVKRAAADVVVDVAELARRARAGSTHRTKATRGTRVKQNMSADERELLERPLGEQGAPAPPVEIVPTSTASVEPARAIAAAINARSDLPYAAKVAGPFADAEPPPTLRAPVEQRATPNEGNPMAAKKKPGPPIVDMTGKKLAGVKVLRPGESNGKGAMWVVEHPCGHTSEVPGAALRAAEKSGGTRRCPECSSSPRNDAAPKASRKPRAATASKPAARANKRPPPATSVSGEAQSYDFPLRRDFTMSVSLPSDLSETDVQRLSKWLGTLVFAD